MNRAHLFLIYGLIGLLFLLWFFQNPEDSRKELHAEEITLESSSGETMTFSIPEPKVRIFELPETISFADETVPLNDAEVKERFEREIYVNAYWQSNMILLMKRAGKYLPTIERILNEQGVPDDFKYLAMAESGLMNVVSPAGARGFWQFMPATAKEYNLEVSNDVDERYHLEKSTEATCKYLKSAFAKFGNWTAVAASYNMGINGFGRRLQEQRQASYYDLLLNDETSRYLFRILAFKEIFENPVKYGFELKEKEIYQPAVYRELIIDSSVDNLANWAIQHNSNYKELKNNNPWLRSSSLNVKRGKTYTIRLPVQN
ncbi:Membrane-bound lytic murein transglycosylase D precursor [Indibacter alkaliphilus LW1]|uniref:Membrane-bound lytic murein transglycosylase D n=1 Tax=Indibacter alkaliphilus (strain CCUG 57479 / KCTC 22604 / LW1) TaxID=1189612 RepID=S2DHN8_INDAL|nr:lytic transglycosylase domain-containing protein [Indibacter alkaliphilus]EOZ96655.1 Membrane-bound lytic murein transglycosylase D precursor [Indibacter alkaliphilus LW1]